MHLILMQYTSNFDVIFSLTDFQMDAADAIKQLCSDAETIVLVENRTRGKIYLETFKEARFTALMPLDSSDSTQNDFEREVKLIMPDIARAIQTVQICSLDTDDTLPESYIL